MLKENSVLRAEAREALANKWGMAAVVTFVYVAIACVLGWIPKVSFLVSLLVVVPLSYGFNILFLGVFRGNEVQLERIFDGFKDYGRVLGTMLLVGVYTFLWTLLLIVPGIIKAYSYMLTPYILKERPELKFNEAINESMRLMGGNKMKLFLLDLSFFGWYLLCILTLGIGLCWLNPYVCTSHAAFYEDIMKEERGEQPEQ